MLVIEITDITNVDHTGPDRANYRFSIVSGSFPDVKQYFQKFPSPQLWMKDVCIFSGSTADTTGSFADLGGSASHIKVGSVLELYQ